MHTHHALWGAALLAALVCSCAAEDDSTTPTEPEAGSCFICQRDYRCRPQWDPELGQSETYCGEMDFHWGCDHPVFDSEGRPICMREDVEARCVDPPTVAYPNGFITYVTPTCPCFAGRLASGEERFSCPDEICPDWVMDCGTETEDAPMRWVTWADRP